MAKNKTGINLKFILLGTAIGIPAALLLGLAGFLVLFRGTQLATPLAPTPLPPTIAAPRGDLPPGPIGLAEYALYQGREYAPVGSGFLLQLASGERLGVTTAHSVPIGRPARSLERIVYRNPPQALQRIAFRVPGQPGNVAEFDALYGAPGRPMDGVNLAMDYVLLLADDSVDPRLFLAPDPRGGPQPGERVSLYSGVKGTPGERYELVGTVLSADAQAAWVLMDQESLNAGMMSGSPFLSRHTGQVVGMAVAASPRQLELFPTRYRTLIGMHPIGSIVDKARAAESFPAIGDYRR